MPHLHLERLQFLFPEPVEEFFPAQESLLHSELCKRVGAEGAVARRHAQSASSPTGNTGEALAPREEEHRHLVEGHIAAASSLGLLKDGRCCGQTNDSSLKSDVPFICATRWHNIPTSETC